MQATSERRFVQVASLVYWASFLAFAEFELLVPDGAGYYVYTKALVSRWDLAIVEELKLFGAWDFFAITPLGHAHNVFALGTSLLWLPFVSLAWCFSRLGQQLG